MTSAPNPWHPVVAVTGGYVVPVTAPPIEGGVVLIEGGRITDSGRPADVLARHQDELDVDVCALHAVR